MATAFEPGSRRSVGRLTPRKGRRSSLSLPALIRLFGRQHGARVHNLSCGGAMIECEAPVREGDPIELCCGTIETTGTAVWVKPGRFGLEFLGPVDEEQIVRQLRRSEAVACRRDQREAAKNG